MLYFKYKKARKSDADIKCNLCGCDLTISNGYSYSHVEKCSNANCLSNTEKTFVYKRLSYFDDDACNVREDLKISYWCDEKGHSHVHEARIARYGFLLRSINKNLKKFTKGEAVWSIEYLIDRGYTEIRAKEILDERKSKTSHFQVRFWTDRGLSAEEAKEKISSIQSANADKVNYDKRICPQDIRWWMQKGLSEEAAKNAQSKFYKEKYSINRNNCKDYDRMIANRIAAWEAKSSEEKSEINKSRGKTFEQLIEKFGFGKAVDILDKRNAAFKKKNWSKSSKRLFTNLEKLIDDKCYYAEEEKFYMFGKQRYYADFAYKNIIVEFNGDIFHANPIMYAANDTPNPFAKDLTAKQIWENDNIRKQHFEDNGFTYLVVWESEYNNNKFLHNEIYEKIKTLIN
jgi:hypothetical protein